MKADDYRGQPVNICQGRMFEPWSRRGFLSIEPLAFLHGKPWNDIALAYVHALRPTRVRVVQDSAQMNSERWRVTVWLEKDGVTINSISQEVEVGLPDNIRNGSELRQELKKQ